MPNILDLFTEDFTVTLVVFLVLFAAIVYFAAGKKSAAVLSGLILIIFSLFSSPFVYLKNAVLGLADRRSKGATDFEQTKQYLLNKLLFVLQALLVVVSVAILAIGFVSGWNQMMPSQQLRETIGATEEGLKKLTAELQGMDPAVKQMETMWTTRRDSLINVYEADRPHRAEMMVAQNNDLAGRINSLSDTARQALSDIRSYHIQNEYLDQASQYEPVMTEIASYIERQDLSSEVKTLLLAYNDNWYAHMLCRFESGTLSENQLRFAVYPAYHSRQRRLDYLKETIPSQEKDLAQYRSEVKYNFGAFGLQILFTLLQFILFVWVIGLLIESLSLTIEVAAGVQKIREHLTKQ